MYKINNKKKKTNDNYTKNDIAIFVLTHNRAEYLKQSIDSLLNQTVGIQEIVVLDNESTDNTRDIVTNLSDRGVKYIKTSGFLGNFNKVKELVSKPYVMLFHDDDLIHPRYLEIVLEILNTYSDISIITTRYTEFKNNDIPLFNKNISSDFFMFNTQSDFASFLYYKEIVAYAPAIYKTENFKSIDLEYDKFNKFNDWPFMVKIANLGKSIILKDLNMFLVRRHVGQDTWTTTNVPTIQQLINWDLFFKHVLKADYNYKQYRKFKKRYKHFLLGKYNAFLLPEDKINMSESEVIKLAIKQGIEDFDLFYKIKK